MLTKLRMREDTAEQNCKTTQAGSGQVGPVLFHNTRIAKSTVRVTTGSDSDELPLLGKQKTVSFGSSWDSHSAAPPATSRSTFSRQHQRNISMNVSVISTLWIIYCEDKRPETSWTLQRSSTPVFATFFNEPPIFSMQFFGAWVAPATILTRWTIQGLGSKYQRCKKSASKLLCAFWCLRCWACTYQTCLSSICYQISAPPK